MIPCLTLALLLVSGVSWAGTESSQFSEGSEPEGFRGIAWGTDLSTVPGMTMVGKTRVSSVYQRADDDLTVGDAKLTKILYYAYDGKFYEARLFLKEGEKNWEALRIEEAQNWQALRAAMQTRYGPGYDVGGGTFYYSGAETGIGIRFPKNESMWAISLYSKALARAARAAEKQAAKQ
jgi:hypothetical protein